MATSELWRLSASETARGIRAGDFTAEDAVSSAIDRMNAVNPQLNAVVEDLSGAALEHARILDKGRQNGVEPGPLHGVPVTIKVNVDQKGHATTNGVTALKDAIAPANAPVVDNLIKAGAVVIGRTNTPEFSFRADTDNALYGRTHNPWGDHISAGGSSGGAGAAVMAGIGGLAHGNDIGGSLRFPAAANGAVTVKPGLGRVPAWNPGQKAERGMLAQAMSVQGVVTRTAADLALSMPSLMAPDARDPFHIPLPYTGPALDRPVKVAFTKETFGFDLHPEVSAALDTARDLLIDAGYIVEDITPPMARDTGEVGYRTLLGEVAALMKADIDAAGTETIQEIFAEYFRQFPPYQGQELLQRMAQRTDFARQWSLFLEDYPLVLTPFLPQPFFRPGRDTEGPDGVREVLGAAIWSYAMNFVGLPAGCLPTRLAQLPQGPQPINVQIIGRRWREDLIVQAMQAIETRMGGMFTTLWQRMG